MDGNCTNWFYLCLALLGVLLAMLAMFFNYSLKIKDKAIELEKKHEENKNRCYKLEQKNGAEQRQINELKEEIRKLKEQKPQNHEKSPK